MDGKNVDFCWEWWPLAGIKKIGHSGVFIWAQVFPSPRGDKENLCNNRRRRNAKCFRPLAGIKKISERLDEIARQKRGFRPLAGIKKILSETLGLEATEVSVPSRG